MLLKFMGRVFDRSYLANIRKYSFKPIKRPDLTSASKKEYVGKKMKDFSVQQILRAKIEMTGPLTGVMITDLN